MLFTYLVVSFYIMNGKHKNKNRNPTPRQPLDILQTPHDQEKQEPPIKPPHKKLENAKT